MEFFLAIGLFSLMIGLFFVWIEWQLRNEDMTATMFARLTKCKYQQNAKIRKGRYGQKTVKHFVAYEYTYRVDGKNYKLTGNQLCTPRDIPQNASVTYLKKLPWAGEIKGLAYGISWPLAFGGIMFACFFLGIWLFSTFRCDCPSLL